MRHDHCNHDPFNNYPMRRALVVGALGVVYGDIGTSPIYTLRECLKAAGGGNAIDVVLGQLSLVFCALMIVVTAKYVLFVMRADNDGEGGIMALLGLAAHSENDERRRTALLMCIHLKPLTGRLHHRKITSL
jgi:KUP system potassium uptake protein